ncbi:hypothetical protein MKX03_025167 [Papaver bracteatum]|nr:hypothetical protein MKX03_025167 [Papaver bracteatum]
MLVLLPPAKGSTVIHQRSTTPLKTIQWVRQPHKPLQRRNTSFSASSYCPICRREYNHFPSICELLHFLLLKMYPETYRRREKQLLEVEKTWGVFSPQLDLSSSCVNSDPKAPSPPTNFISGHETNSSVKTSSTPTENSKNFVELSHGGSANSPVKSAENFVITNNADIEENTYLNYKACKPVSINDALCITFKQMRFQPVILNCSHAYCESCLEVPENEALSCQLCQFPHPNGFPKVCLVFDNFLEREFPQEYARRREDVQHKPVCSQQGTASSSSFLGPVDGSQLWRWRIWFTTTMAF